jgi:hypothetical protein
VEDNCKSKHGGGEANASLEAAIARDNETKLRNHLLVYKKEKDLTYMAEFRKEAPGFGHRVQSLLLV